MAKFVGRSGQTDPRKADAMCWVWIVGVSIPKYKYCRYLIPTCTRSHAAVSGFTGEWVLFQCLERSIKTTWAKTNEEWMHWKNHILAQTNNVAKLSHVDELQTEEPIDTLIKMKGRREKMPQRWKRNCRTWSTNNRRGVTNIINNDRTIW